MKAEAGYGAMKAVRLSKRGLWILVELSHLHATPRDLAAAAGTPRAVGPITIALLRLCRLRLVEWESPYWKITKAGFAALKVAR